ncbi:MAG TPA: ABC transporter substrate-binding protein, partial [Asanoa sp.]|nr:ABC transporter substrate-binding protein [Asanoa sp.]
MRLYGRRRITPILIAATAVIALAACSSGGATKNAGAAVGAPVSGGTMTIGIQDPPADLDPQTIGSFSEDFIKNNISDKLIYQNPKTMALEPWLATSWTKNDAYTEFVLKLRSDVTFSDGSALTPEVVKANIDMLAFGDDALGVPPQKGLLNGYASTDVTGENQITVKFSTTNTGFLPALSGRPFGIVGAAMLKLTRQERAKPQNVVAS